MNVTVYVEDQVCDNFAGNTQGPPVYTIKRREELTTSQTQIQTKTITENFVVSIYSGVMAKNPN